MSLTRANKPVLTDLQKIDLVDLAGLCNGLHVLLSKLPMSPNRSNATMRLGELELVMQQMIYDNPGKDDGEPKQTSEEIKPVSRNNRRPTNIS